MKENTMKGRISVAQKLDGKELVTFKELLMSNSVMVDTLGIVFLDGKNANLEMVKAGLAKVYRGEHAKGFDSAPYWEAEKEAREAQRGMWVQGDKCVSPKEWRRVHGR
jgi:endonuclease YncB( thermonuclease family)